MRIFSTLSLALCGLAATASAQQTIVVTDADLVGGQTYNWTANNTYLLNGLVYLEAGGRINIAAGTVVKFRTDPDGTADADNTSALIIAKGAQIFADGTKDAPVIFTAEADDVSDPDDLEFPLTNRGQWGGLIILGNGTLASVGSVAQVEGISPTETRASFGGGSTPNDAESSGRLRYVSIRHGGKALTTDNEINGLTLGGVGRGTEIDYVEVFANDDDGIEWFGGTVDVKHAVVAYGADDSYDYDLGWRGRGQFWFSLNGSDVSGRAGEHDGAIPDGQEPFSNPTIANATYIGSGANATSVAGEGNDYAIVLRDGGATKYYNSIFTDFTGRLLDLEDLQTSSGVDSYQRLLDGDVVFAGNVIGAFGRVGGLDSLIRRYPAGDQPSGDRVVSLITMGNRYVGNDNILASISRERGGNLDPRPAFNGPALARSERATIPASAAGPAGFFESVDYAGAFPAADGNWMAGWTALDHYDVLTNQVVGVEEVIATQSVGVFPNPTRQGATLRYDVRDASDVRVGLYDLTGRQIFEEVHPRLAGEQLDFISTNGLGAGVYFIRLSVGEQTVTARLTVID